MYLVYIRPLFEYACEVWDNCGICYSNKLEQTSIRLCQNCNRFTHFYKFEVLYAETGWETQSERRYSRKLHLFFNVKMGNGT